MIKASPLFTEMYLTYHDRAVQYANRIMRDWYEAQDLVEDAWLVVLRQNDIREETFWWYFRRIVRLKCKDRVRDREARRKYYHTVPISPYDSYHPFTVIDPLRRLCDREDLIERLQRHHGTLGGYNNHHCRCERCRKANADYQREYRQARIAR